MQPKMAFTDFFNHVVGKPPFPYQVRLAEGPWPEVLDIPTGLGKTAAVIAAWLYKRLTGDTNTGRRLIYCLPMRTLVHQTADVAVGLCSLACSAFEERALEVPTVHAMLGGDVDEDWEACPERPVILVGTQDMLLSRALARGYAMSRYKWPIHFGLLHNDCLWAFDEIQLMGVGVETSAQLDAFRSALGCFGAAHSVWMSATVAHAQLSTVDHPEPEAGFRRLALDAADFRSFAVSERTAARKAVARAGRALEKGNEEAYSAEVAALSVRAHTERGGLTLVVVNRVSRAQAVYEAIVKLGAEPCALVHSRFRPRDRERQELLLKADGDRIVVATQAVEAGVDVSARTLLTELAPWTSLVQRFGRCNRYGEQVDARVLWLDILVENDASLASPYEPAQLAESRRLLVSLQDVGPSQLSAIDHVPSDTVRPVLRRRDLVDLFDTSPDLLGNDIDISRFVRDGDDTDIFVYYRVFEGDPEAGMPAATRDELVRVSVGAARVFLDRMKKKRQALGDSTRDRDRKRFLQAWVWNPLAPIPWMKVSSVRPGQVLLLHGGAGGYDAQLGWTGDVLPPRSVDPITLRSTAPPTERMDTDPRTDIRRWIALSRHLADVAGEVESLTDELAIRDPLKQSIIAAALWHDVGKAHPEFQRRLVEPVRDNPTHGPPGDGPWAKSSHRLRAAQGGRPYFRHELASALAWLQAGPSNHPCPSLVAYLIASHHGKVRLSIRSVPGERPPPEPERLFARGVWDKDRLPEVRWQDGTCLEPLDLDLSPMLLGEGSWLERTLGLRDDPTLGPFRLAFLEALVRIADWRASEKEDLDA